MKGDNQMQECLFCKIIKGEIPADIIYSNESIVAFRDIKPAAPVHVLIVPRRHVADLLELAGDSDGAALMQQILLAVPEVARRTGVDKRGFRLINNCGEEGGQTIPHVHFHLIGGRKLGEKLL